MAKLENEKATLGYDEIKVYGEGSTIMANLGISSVMSTVGKVLGKNTTPKNIR